MAFRPSAPRAALALLLAVSLGACANEPRFPTSLTPEEERLVEEVLALIEVRISRARSEDEGRAAREALPELYTQAELDALLDELSRDPARGQLVMGAVHESLRARRVQMLRPPDEDR